MKIILTENQFKRVILKEQSSPTITDVGFEGTYNGPEFNQKGDIAHQFVNTASNLIGNKLKELYNKGKYSKVNFKDIEMSTDGMNSGTVEFKLKIPFERVSNECDAYTSFDHRGGWGHGEGYKLDDLKDELKSAPTKGTSLDISDMKKTPEGLVEYFAQWKNPNYQSHCGGDNKSKPITITFNDLGDARDQLLALPKDNYGSATIKGNTITITKDGDTITGISGIPDNISEDTLKQRLTDMKNKYGYEVMSDIVKVGSLWFVVLKLNN
tara:strand:- start:57 stop:860 length:804 start_codon:yes stop_codon:yes gene_type:complete